MGRPIIRDAVIRDAGTPYPGIRRFGTRRFGTRHPGARDAGFTLVEVLVAFVIAALALGVLFRGGLDGLVSARVAGRMEEAVARAQSRLTALCHGAKLADGTQSGDDGGGFAWRSSVATAGVVIVPRVSEDEPRRPLRATLFAVHVTISWGSTPARAVTLDTSCLSLAKADGA